MELRNQRVWLIGASSGIGAELAVELGKRGATLALSARRRDKLEEVAARVQAAGSTAEVFPLDVTDGDAVRTVAADVAAAGPIDILLYGAGDWTITNVYRYEHAAVEKQMNTNFLGLSRAVEAVLPAMMSRKRGEIVGIASVAGYRGIPRAEAYGATKAAEINFLEALRVDLKPTGIGVTTVCPGFVDTPLTRKNDFPMPFKVSAETAAETIANGMQRGKKFIEFPRRFGIIMKTLRFLPVWLFDIVGARMRQRRKR